MSAMNLQVEERIHMMNKALVPVLPVELMALYLMCTNA
jgi:hypothetical protein